MMILVTTFVTVLVSTALASKVSTDEVQQWLQYKAEYGKTYRNLEDEWRRFNIFLSNKDIVESHNSRYELGELTYTVALNQFADMTNEEFRARLVPQSRGPSDSSSAKSATPTHHTEIPESIDWRSAGAVTEVSDEGQCESGWAFSSAGAIEALHQQTSGVLIKLSAQQLVDCAPEVDPCRGGHVPPAFDYILTNRGIDTDESYPYICEIGDCKDNVSVLGANMTSYKRISKGDEADLTKAVALRGPVAVQIDASHVSFQFYFDGVYYEKDCQTELLNHGVLVVGYGVLNGSDYYLVKNSWGTTWGQRGYINMARNRGNNCGIASAAYYPIL